MPRSVRSFLPVGPLLGDPVPTFTGDPGRWLPAARHAGPDRWQLDVTGLGIDRPVEVVIGDAWHVGSTWWRALRWTPLADTGDALAVERLLPSLDAELGLTKGGDAGHTLVLDGSYDPPGGMVGEALDAVALGRLARRTIRGLLAAVAQNLRAEHALSNSR